MAKRVRRTDRELFLDYLQELSGGGKKMVSNTSLRTKLKWDAKKYNPIKNEYWDEGSIIVGRGRGGTLTLATGKKATIRLFLSYSKQDDVIASKLLKHLEPLRRLGLLETWDFRELKAGEEWDKKISKELEAADIVAMLVSIDFINSGYITDVEVERALARQKHGNTILVPIIARNCLWKTSPLGEFQALPRDGTPIVSWRDIDDALMDVATGIREIAERLITEKA